MTYADIIKLWPSMRVMSEDIGEHTATVKKWRQRDFIPCEYWLRVIAAAKERRFRGVSLKRLAELAATESRL